ncbi:Uncharacterised protein [Mycobacteroides abscessus subsp. abscessus]|nr:Uncharacterised protein [Mycobacteroides abscessus subsp. abscessus]
MQGQLGDVGLGVDGPQLRTVPEIDGHLLGVRGHLGPAGAQPNCADGSGFGQFDDEGGQMQALYRILWCRPDGARIAVSGRVRRALRIDHIGVAGGDSGPGLLDQVAQLRPRTCPHP